MYQSQNQMMKRSVNSLNQNGLDDELAIVVQNVLEHHGVQGQEWGKQHGPPYPLNRVGKKELREQKKKAKEAKRLEREKEKAKKRMIKQQQRDVKSADKLEKAAREKMEKEEKLKKKYSKTAEDLYKHRELYTYQEIQEALQKFEWENKIKDYMDKDLIRSKNKAEQIAKRTQSVVSFAKSAIDGYNIVVGVGDVFGLDLPPVKIPSSSGEKKDDQRRN